MLIVTELCFLVLLHHFHPSPNLRPGGLPAPAPSHPHFSNVFSPHRIICQTGCHLSQSQYTDIIHSLNNIHLPPLLPCPRRTFQINIFAPLSLPKSFRIFPSDASESPFAAATDHCAFPLPSRQSPYRKPQVLASTPPTLPLLPEAYKCTSCVYVFHLL